VTSVLVLLAMLAQDGRACPAAEFLPQLTIDRLDNPALPIMDEWQVFWGDVP